MNIVDNKDENFHETNVSKRKVIRLPFRIICFCIGIYMSYTSINIILNYKNHELIGLYVFIPLGFMMSFLALWLALIKEENINF